MGRSFRWAWASNGNAASIIDAARTNAFAGMFGDTIPPSGEGGDILRKVYAVGAKIISRSNEVAKGSVGARSERKARRKILRKENLSEAFFIDRHPKIQALTRLNSGLMRRDSLRAENESVETNREHVKPRTFSAETAEKTRHPAGFNRAWSKLRCRAEGFVTRPQRCVQFLQDSRRRNHHRSYRE